MRIDPGILTVDGRRGTGKTDLAIKICRTYGAALLELGPLFRIVAWQRSQSPTRPMSTAVDRSLHLVMSGDLTFGPLDHRSPGGLRISFRGRDLTQSLWSSDLDAGLSRLAGSQTIAKEIRPLIRLLSTSRPLVVVGREAGSKFFPRAALKLVLTTHDCVREARKQRQLVHFSSGSNYEGNSVDSSEPKLSIRTPSDSMIIDTTKLTSAQLFAKVAHIVDERLRWPAARSS